MLNLESLKRENVRMKNEAEVMKKINKIVGDGAKKLQIVADFDATLTKQHVNGTPVPNCIVMFFGSKQIPASRLKRIKALYLKHSAVEKDPQVSLDERTESMNEWYAETVTNLVGIKFDREEIRELSEAHRHVLRDGTEDLFVKLKGLDVPVLVCSAGVGDMVKGILRSRGILLDNVSVMANFLRFDGDTLNGFENAEHVLHPHNKSSHTVGHDYFEAFRERTNVLLMGDSLGDASMADEGDRCVLKIGFFHQAKESLSCYMEAFDIVLLDDQTMDVALEIIDLVPIK